MLIANAYAIREPNIPRSEVFKDGGIPDDERLNISVSVSTSPELTKSSNTLKPQIDYLFSWETQKETRIQRDTIRIERRRKAMQGA